MCEIGNLSVTVKKGEDVILTMPDGREIEVYVQEVWQGHEGKGNYPFDSSRSEPV